MKRALVINVEEGITDDLLVFSGRFVPDILTDRLKSCADSIVISIPESYRGKLSDRKESIVRKNDDISCWKDIAAKTDSESLVRVFADSPFIDPSIISEMCEVHEKYLAEFTYSENLPAGLSCEIFSSELIKSLPVTDEKRLPLAQVIRSNINQFDVELFYKAPDIRDKRIFFRSRDKREKKIMEELYSRNAGYPSYDDLKKLIEDNCDALYAGPSYLEIELTGNAEIETIYSWRKAIKSHRGNMDLPLLKKILSETASFGLNYTVCFGGAGDPMLHPSFYEALDMARAEPLVNAIMIETDGTQANHNFTQYIGKANDPRITVIVEMNGYNSETYLKIHGCDRFDEVKKNIILLRDAFNSNLKNLYIQLMKINETEQFLDEYYDFWEAEKVQIILQKQNTCLGLVEDRKYYDLTPLERVPCWHLQRDLFILSDGTVGFCKQDINGSFSKWNLKNASLGDIWDSKKVIFVNDYKGKRSTSPDCAKCDEWYTFNM
jgi:spiro-SPASM protein